MDYGILAATLYLLCAFAFGGWFIFQRFRGGRNSEFFEDARRRHPGVDAMNPWFLYVSAALGVIAYAIVWPYSLTRNLLAMRETRHNAVPLFLHPRLSELRKELRGREEQYEKVLTAFGLEAVVTALHAIDLPVAVTLGLDAIARKNRVARTGDGAAERPSAADYEVANYVAVIKVALDVTELEALNSSMRRANLRRALAIGDEIARRFDHLRNPGKVIGDLIAFRVHGWAPMGRLTLLKQQYSLFLKAEFNNADHLAAIVSGIRVTDERDVKVVDVRGADLTGDEHKEIVKEHRTGSTPRTNDREPG